MPFPLTNPMATEKVLPASLGRYQVLEELGAGAMGVVYLCVDPRLQRPVAIKVVRENELMPEAEREQYQARFRNEAEAAGRMNHPDIVRIFDVGPAYMVMEYLEGRSLSTVMRDGVVLSVRQVASLVLRVADAVDYAHRNGIVHRDIKPANVMLLNDGGVKVMDFGVARLQASTLTVAGTVVGSVRYMSPEQMMGEKVDGRADVFSLAAVAYELLTACPPFPGQTITEVVSRVVQGNYVPPRQADERLPEELNGVFARAFAVKLDERYAKAVDFARDLHEAAKPVLDLEISHGHEPGATPTEVDADLGLATVAASTALDVPKPAVRPPKEADETMAMPPRPAATSKSGPDLMAKPGATLIMSAPTHREAVLLLDSDPPGAHVYLDGDPVGRAPVSGLEVTFGRHVVRMEVGGRDPVSAEVEVKADRPLKAVTLTLPPPGPRDGSIRRGQFVPFGPQVAPPRRVAGSVPAYPESARGMEGAPVVELWISETGDVIDVAIVESAGGVLDGALLEAVAGWRFEPATVRGVPVSVRLTVQHLFRQ